MYRHMLGANMENEPLLIAQRKFLVDDGAMTSAKIYAPAFLASASQSGTWQCLVEVDGILPAEVLGEGRDSFHALEMAMCALGALLVGLQGSRKLRLPEDFNESESAGSILVPDVHRVRQPSMISDLFLKSMDSFPGSGNSRTQQ
jgi:hypothetical protein